VQRLLPLALVYLVVAAAYFAMSLCQWAMRAHDSGPAPTRNRLMADVRDGWTATRRSRPLFLIVICFAIYNVAYGAGFYIVLPRLAGDELQGGVAGYGLAVAMYGAGGIVGNIVLGLISVSDKFRTVLLGFAFMTVGFAAFGFVPDLTTLLLVCALSSLGLPMMDVCMPALIHELVEPTHHGRVYATWRYLAEIGITIGIVSAGPMVDWLGPSYAALFYAAAVTPFVCAFAVLVRRSQSPRLGPA
jgi:dTMP kinase